MILLFCLNLFSDNIDSRNLDSPNLDSLEDKKLEKVVEEINETILKKKPWIAMSLSIIPGAGQIYNEDYWKAPILFGAASGFVYAITSWQNNFNEMQNLLDSDEIENYNIEQVKLRREFYRDQRDQASVYLALIYVVTILDAYAGAHLWGFDTGDDLSLNFSFSSWQVPQVGFRLKF
jgi:Family of unknown function (DUF5683)